MLPQIQEMPSNVREGAELQEQVSFAKIVVSHTLHSFWGIVAYKEGV
jgi:hypothetical protein